MFESNIAGSATVLEEGIATLFSIHYCIRNGHGVFPIGEPYLSAMQAVQELLAIDESIIKKLRKEHPTISLISVAQLKTANEQLPTELVNRLTGKFA